MRSNLYNYRAEFLTWYDGDTVTKSIIDTGFGHQIINQRIRLKGVDAMEIKNTSKKKLTPEERVQAKAAKARFRELTEKKELYIRTERLSKNKRIDKYGKYGRWICKVYVPVEELPQLDNHQLANAIVVDQNEMKESGLYQCYYDIIEVLKIEGHVKSAYEKL